jgi:hypothetical protein
MGAALQSLYDAFADGPAALAYADEEDAAREHCRISVRSSVRRAWLATGMDPTGDPLWDVVPVGRPATKLAWLNAHCVSCGRCSDMGG